MCAKEKGKKHPAAPAGRSSAGRATAGATSTGADPATRTRLLRSMGTDHLDTQKELAHQLRPLAMWLNLDPDGSPWATEILPAFVAVFNVGRAVALRSVARAYHGEADPGEFPPPLEVEIDPGHDVRLAETCWAWTPLS